jgi:hypothetical protein
MIDINVVNFITIGIIALLMLALFKWVGNKFDIGFLKG